MDTSLFIIEGLSLVVAASGSYAVTNWRLNRFDKDFEEYKNDHKDEVEEFRKQKQKELDEFKNDSWREVDKLRQWRHMHQEESANTRLEIEKKFGHLYVMVANVDGKFAPITEMMAEIIKRLDKIDGKIDRIETRDE